MPEKSFTLIEIIITVAIIGILSGAALFYYSSYLNTQKLFLAANQIVSDLRGFQNTAKTEHQDYSVAFSGGQYTVNSLKTIKLHDGVSTNSITIKFSPSGFVEPGFSGTIVVACGKKTKKVVVSSVGRIRIE